MIVWLTGQPGSGKSTLARRLGVDFVVDGDNLRKLQNPGYTEAGRRTNVDRAQAIAAYLEDLGHSVAVALVAPYRDQREAFKRHHQVIEVFLHTDEARGRERYFADDYAPPTNNYLDIDTGEHTIEQALRIIHRAMAAATPRSRMVNQTTAQ